MEKKTTGKNAVELGDKVKDAVTGFTGIVTGMATYLNGCTRCSVQNTKLKDGIPTETQWFDMPQLSVVKKGVVKRGSQDTGGPMPSMPKHNPIPTR